MTKKLFKNIGIIAIITLLLYSFYLNASWMELCAGLAFFLFGMQSMQDGLTQLAGGKLEQILAKSTETPLKSLLFGISSTAILQSTTVVSLLIIAFISTGLITLSAGIGIVIGANVGASGGIWLLALAGQNVSLGPFAYPMIVIGILASFAGKPAKAGGRVLIGVAFILLAIDLIKNGFSDFTQDFDILSYELIGWSGIFILVGIGLVLTIILQSSHASIMLILTMLSLEQITTIHAFALTIGAIVGSAITTGILGFIGGNRSGMRVAGAHVIYNAGTAVIILILFQPIVYLISYITAHFDINSLTELAIFYTIFNIVGLLLFWPLKTPLATLLEKIIPELPEPAQLIETVDEHHADLDIEVQSSKFLLEANLSSTRTAMQAVMQELSHLSRISLEVICHILYLNTSVLSAKAVNQGNINDFNDFEPQSADILYQKYIKNLYSELLTFISKIQYHESDDKYQQIMATSQIIAFKLVSAVKNSHHLQKNLRYYLTRSPSTTQQFYMELREYIVKNLRTTYQMHFDSIDIRDNPEIIQELQSIPLSSLIEQSREFEGKFRTSVYTALKENRIDGFNTSSILNDLNYSTQLVESLFNILKVAAIQENNLIQSIDEILQIKEEGL
ncbi:Na/Pi cotransporter family protein [Ignatzschineria sp. LJL83]